VPIDKLPLPASALLRAGEWLLRSGIQEPSGGVARYYLVAESRNLPVSTEITGYAASAFAYLARLTGDERYHVAALRTADFLILQAWNPQLETFPFELSPGSPSYFFDCGIIIRGLLAVARLTRQPQYVEIASVAGLSMARDFLTPTAIHPVVALPSLAPLPYENRWSRQPGCFQLKSALAWLKLARITGDTRYEQWWEQALAQALASWDSFIPGTAERLAVMDRLHAHCYFLEALLAVPARAECARVLAAGIAKTASYLRELAPEFVRSDVYAQLLRVRLFADAYGVLPLDAAAAADEAAAVASFQYRSADTRLDGGFAFGRRGAELLPFANPVSTVFCLQALEMWREHQARRFEPDLDSLI
jgi:hypothetical protein